MGKLLKIILFYVIPVGFTGCIENNNGQFLALAEACIERCPDSASVLLEKVGNSKNLSDSQYAKFALLWTQMQHKCHLRFENDSLINIAINYYIKSGDKHRAAKALFYKGLICRQCKDAEHAAEAFSQSEQYFEGIEDDRYKALLFNYFGYLMHEQTNYERAVYYYKKCLHHEMKGDSVHYIASSCSQIANVYILLNQMDSARHYYEKGLSYREQIPDRYYYNILHNYANFLRKNGEYAMSEKMLLECESYMSDSLSLYKVYSSLATLYYDKAQYSDALAYAKRILGSSDSIMLRGGYLHLYRIYFKTGDKERAEQCHLIYRQYHSDITMRLKTAEVAAIPYQVKAQSLQTKNQKGQRIQRALIIWVFLLLAIGGITFYCLRKRNRQKLFEQKLEIGKLNSKITRKDKKISKQMEELQKGRSSLKKKDNEIEQLKEADSIIIQEKRELEKDLETSHKQQRELQMVVDRMEHDKSIDQRIMYFRADEKVEHIGALLMQLKHGNMYVGEPVPEQEILPMLTALLDAEYSGVRQRMDALTGNPTKRMMCYLMALELDDEEMMYRATGKRLETIRKYHKECRQLVDSWMG